MHQWFFTRTGKRGMGAVLAIFGIGLWIAAVTLHVLPPNMRDVSFPHLEARLIGIVAGGVAVTGGIALLAAA